MLNEYIKKRINFNFSKQKLVFDLSDYLFSSNDIDQGTKSLINSLRKNKEIKYEKILDLGCGYGIIGIFLKRQNPDCKVECVDRNELAVRFTEHNALINNCKIKVYPSLDYSEINRKFDLIVCNFPAKAGIKALKKFVYNASLHLNENGIFTIVIVEELTKDFENILNEKIQVVYSEKTRGYSIYHLKFLEKINFNQDAYFRERIKFRLDNKEYELETAINIAEFESPNYSTLCAINILKKLSCKDITIIDPCQGHIAIAVLNYLNPNSINLVSTDLLSLEYSEKNLKKNYFFNTKRFYEIGDIQGELLIWRINEEKEDKLLYSEFQRYKRKFKNLIIFGKKTKIKRVIKNYKDIQEMKNFLAVLI